MRRSLTLKLTLAFLIVSLIGVVLVAVLSRVIAEREFDRLTQGQAQERFTEGVTNYYQIYGSWDGLDDALRRRMQSPPSPPNDTLPGPMLRLHYTLANPEGLIVVANNPNRINERAPQRALEQGTPLIIDGEMVGTIIFDDGPPPRNPMEEQFLARTNRATVIAAVVATIIALGLGILLARTLTRPLREMTAAAQAMAKGDLEQSVPVRSQDEVGQLAQSFNQMSADLAHATLLRRQMTADIAHDLRTPLTVITGYLEALRDGDLQATPERFEAMHSEAQHLKRLVQDLRTLSLADAGELPLNIQSISAPELLTRVVAAYQHQAAQQQVSLNIESAPDLPNFNADPDRLVQVLENLVSNALRYTPENGQITLSAQAQHNQMILTVQDTGSGISPDELPHIFNRFYRGDKSRKQDEEAESGLGLAIAKAIVEMHQGTISVESEPGQGTTFFISLPF